MGGRRNRSGARCRGVCQRPSNPGRSRLHGFPRWSKEAARRSSPRPVPTEQSRCNPERNADALRDRLAELESNAVAWHSKHGPPPFGGTAVPLAVRFRGAPPRSMCPRSTAAPGRSDCRSVRASGSRRSEIDDDSLADGCRTRLGHQGLDAVPQPADTRDRSRPTASAGFGGFAAKRLTPLQPLPRGRVLLSRATRLRRSVLRSSPRTIRAS